MCLLLKTDSEEISGTAAYISGAESTVCESEGQALQLTYDLDFLSIQAYWLWMERKSSGKLNEENLCERNS